MFLGPIQTGLLLGIYPLGSVNLIDIQRPRELHSQASRSKQGE